MSRQGKLFYEFDEFRIDPEKRLLLRDQEIVPLTRKAFDTLLVLVRHQGEVMEKEELMKSVWPDSFVEENNLNQSISALRKALGDTSTEHRYVETVARRGYRFAARVREQYEESSDLAPARETAGLRAVQRRDSAPQSIAVLPFKSLSPGGADEYLGLGMADTLITRLSNIRQIVVRPTSAVMKYATGEQDPVSVGQELHVKSVLEGRVRRSAEMIRVTVQLIDVEGGAPLWAGKFDENFTDIFTVEDSISERVAEALTLQFTSEERNLLTKRYTENAEAYRLYLEGRYYANRLSKEGFSKGVECFNRAIALDPQYALAYAGLAHNYSQVLELIMSPQEAMPKAKEAAQQALAIDDNLAEAHAALAGVYFWYEWDWPATERELQRAIELNPNAPNVRWLYGFFLIFMGRFDSGFAEIGRVAGIDPLSFENDLYVAPSLYFARRYDAAIEQSRKSIRENPNFWLSHVIMGRAHEQKGALMEAIAEYQKARQIEDWMPEILGDLGRALAVAGERAEALRIVSELKERSTRAYVAPYSFANIYIGLGDNDQAFAWLEEAYKVRSWYLTWLKVDPALDRLRADPRLTDLIRRVNLT